MRWKKMEGFGGRYSISDCGEIYSHTRNTIMRQHSNKDGYKRIFLVDESGGRRGYYVHRLVAKEFCGGFSEGLEINHKDLDRGNNNYTNLEWVTRLENVRYSVDRGNISTIKAVEATKKPIVRLSIDGEFMSKYDSIQEAVEKYSIDQSSISKVCMKQRNTAGGYIWRYKDEYDRDLL